MWKHDCNVILSCNSSSKGSSYKTVMDNSSYNNMTLTVILYKDGGCVATYYHSTKIWALHLATGNVEDFVF